MGLFKRKARATKGRSVLKNVRPVDMAAILADGDGYGRSWEGFYLTSNGNVVRVEEWDGGLGSDVDDPEVIGGVYYDTVDGDGGIMDYTATDTLGDFNDYQLENSGGTIVGMIEFPNGKVESDFYDAFYEACDASYTNAKDNSAYERMQAIAAKYGLYNRRPRA